MLLYKTIITNLWYIPIITMYLEKNSVVICKNILEDSYGVYHIIPL